MGLFGIFYGWSSRKKGLLEKLRQDVKSSVFQVYGLLLEEYSAKTLFLQNPNQKSFDGLKKILQIEQLTENKQETTVINAIGMINTVLQKESIAVDKSVEQQLRTELTNLVDELSKLKKVFEQQY